MCGVMGILAPPGRDTFREMTDGLFQMQHRGQDACGIALADGRQVRLHRGLGYVREVFSERPSADFQGWIGCGHVRYPTQGSNRLQNAQPHRIVSDTTGDMALCSNGDLTNYHAIRSELETAGEVFQGSNDAELLLLFLNSVCRREKLTIPAAIRVMQARVRGAFSACLVTRDAMYAFCDPFGLRPLCFGGADDAWFLASETTALDINRIDMAAELEPGEIVKFDAAGCRRLPHPDPVTAREGREQPAHCVFEYIYFCRPDAIVHGRRVYDVRKRIGAWLAEHDSVTADLVVPVPDSSNAVALGYAQAAGLPFEFGLIRNHYVGRTFISLDQPRRDDGVRCKFNPLRSVFKDRRVILVDDSIVRGTTTRKLVRMVRAAGAAEVHVRIGSPVTRFSCFYGIDTPTSAELIGNQLSVDGIARHLTADSLMYLTLSGLSECVADGGQFCRACFDGAYPVPIMESKDARTECDAANSGSGAAKALSGSAKTEGAAARTSV